MIPQEKSASVEKGLREAFGVTAFDAIHPMDAGLGSDLLLRMVVGGVSYSLRIMTRIDEINDPRRRFTCMTMAADVEIAPRVRYVDMEQGVCITDFVEEVPLPIDQARLLIPQLLRKLHALPLFPKEFNYVTASKAIERFRRAGILPQAEIDEIFAAYARLCEVYPRDPVDMVSCHSDLKPENILFDEERIWLTDWKAAFVNDRYFDLAVAANFLITDEADELAYLQQYFGESADAYQRARFFLMRQTLHMMYASLFLLLGSGGKPVELSESLPSFEEFHGRLWRREIDLAESTAKIAYGRIHWERLLLNMRQARFDQALRIVGEGNASREDRRALLPVIS
jgi:hypothetical protein